MILTHLTPRTLRCSLPGMSQIPFSTEEHFQNTQIIKRNYSPFNRSSPFTQIPQRGFSAALLENPNNIVPSFLGWVSLTDGACLAFGARDDVYAATRESGNLQADKTNNHNQNWTFQDKQLICVTVGDLPYPQIVQKIDQNF